MKELAEVPASLKELMANKQFKRKMVTHLDYRRKKSKQLEIGQINETTPTEKPYMDNEEIT